MKKPRGNHDSAPRSVKFSREEEIAIRRAARARGLNFSEAVREACAAWARQ